MQATLQLPVRVGREHVDALSGVLGDFQNERARLESFAQELSSEWQQLCDDLAECSASLDHDEVELDKRSQAFAAKMRSASESNVRADELERQLRSAQIELESCRKQMEQVQQERSTVREQLQDVNSGVVSLSELIRIVQSTYTEIEQVQAALGQQATELLSAMEGLASAPAPRQRELEIPKVSKPEPQAANVEPQVEPVAVDDWMDDEPEVEAESEPEEVQELEPSAKRDESVSDPVIGSVLAELTRLGKK